jgi:hypothetical protein
LVGELPPVAGFQLVEDGAPQRADAQRLLEQLHQVLGGQPAGEGFHGQTDKSERGKPPLSPPRQAAAEETAVARSAARKPVSSSGKTLAA